MWVYMTYIIIIRHYHIYYHALFFSFLSLLFYFIIYTLLYFSYFIFYIYHFGLNFKAIGKTLGEQNRIPNKAVPLSKVLTEHNTEKRVAKATIILKSKPASRVKPTVKKEEEKKEDENNADIFPKSVNIRSSLDSEKSENSLYVSALEDVTESVKNGLKFINKVSNIISNISDILFET